MYIVAIEKLFVRWMTILVNDAQIFLMYTKPVKELKQNNTFFGNALFSPKFQTYFTCLMWHPEKRYVVSRSFHVCIVVIISVVLLITYISTVVPCNRDWGHVGSVYCYCYMLVLVKKTFGQLDFLIICLWCIYVYGFLTLHRIVGLNRDLSVIWC